MTEEPSLGTTPWGGMTGQVAKGLIALAIRRDRRKMRDAMINEKMFGWGNEPSTIRELFAYGLKRKAQIGDDKVFDFSIGNPSVPAPQSVADAIRELSELPPQQVHGYTMAAGLTSVREAVAGNLNRRFSTSYGPDDLYLTLGAAASISISINAVCNPGDEIIVISPFFPEYRVWIEHAGCTCVQVPARESDFQIDLDALADAITPKTRVVIVNSPNNPVGVVYSEKTLSGLSNLLEERSKSYGEPIYIVSDEPYRELVYGGAKVSWLPDFYKNTLVCYSWSKSFSLPGERIGYIRVPPEMPDARRVYAAVCGAGRALGFVCATALFQRVIEKCVDSPVNIASYERNRTLLTEGLGKLGYTYIEPQGAFYLWVKALEPDAKAFSERAKAHELLIVPSDSFGVTGWERVSYCVSDKTIQDSMPAFAALKAEY